MFRKASAALSLVLVALGLLLAPVTAATVGGVTIQEDDVAALIGVDNATDLSFVYVGQTTVTFLCTWTTPQGKVQTAPGSSSAETITVIPFSIDWHPKASDPNHNQYGVINNYKLGTVELSADSDVVAECGGYGAGKTLVAGSVSEPVTTGALYVQYDGQRFELPAE